MPAREIMRAVHAVVGLLTLLAAACARGADPVAPTGPISPKPEVTVTAIVRDFSGVPVAGARVCGFPPTGWTFAWSSSPCTDPSTTDPAGRVDFNLKEPRTAGFFTAWKDGYLQPCPAIAQALQSTVDITVTLEPVPPDLPVLVDRRHVSGVVYEKTAGSRRPAPGAMVVWEPIWWGSAAAHTRSDKDGRYRLCGLPREAIVSEISAFWGPHNLHASAPPGGDAVVDFEMPALASP
jgi:hypothetical protein